MRISSRVCSRFLSTCFLKCNGRNWKKLGGEHDFPFPFTNIWAEKNNATKVKTCKITRTEAENYGLRERPGSKVESTTSAMNDFCVHSCRNASHSCVCGYGGPAHQNRIELFYTVNILMKKVLQSDQF